MNTIPTNAVLYLRVSTEEQVENYSLGTQEDICKREADRLGISIIQTFREEGKSAKTIIGRPVLIQLLEYCRKNRKSVKAVIFYKTDRLSRQMIDYLIIKEKLNRIGIKLISATEPINDTPMGNFIGGFYAGVAQLENETRSERTRNGMHARFQSGLTTGGFAPLGYIRHEGYVFKDTKTWDMVHNAWDLMATGTKSLRDIANIMNSWGLRITKKHMTYSLRPQTAARIFRSKFYTGILYSKRYHEEVRGQHEPMITIEEFNKVQEVLDGRTTNKPSLVHRDRANPDFPLRRFVKCGNCGLSFTGAWCKGRLSKYAYYWCHKANICHSPSVPVDDLHDSLNTILKNTKLTKTGYELVQMLFESEFTKRVSKLRLQKSKRDQTISKLLSMRNNLIQKHLSGIYTDDIFLEQNNMITSNIDRMKTADNTTLTGKYTMATAWEYINNKINNIEHSYKNLRHDYKKSLISTIFPNGFVWHYPRLTQLEINPLFEV